MYLEINQGQFLKGLQEAWRISLPTARLEKLIFQPPNFELELGSWECVCVGVGGQHRVLGLCTEAKSTVFWGPGWGRVLVSGE